MSGPLRLDLETTTNRELEEYVASKLEPFYGFKPTREDIQQLNFLFHSGYLENPPEDFYLAMATYEEILHRESRERRVRKRDEGYDVGGMGSYPSLRFSIA